MQGTWWRMISSSWIPGHEIQDSCTVSCLMQATLLLSPSPPLLQMIFRPPLDFYDILIHLNAKHIPRHLEGVDRPAKSFSRGMLKSDAPVKTLVFPVVGYDPVQCYLQELRVSVALTLSMRESCAQIAFTAGVGYWNLSIFCISWGFCYSTLT